MSRDKEGILIGPAFKAKTVGKHLAWWYKLLVAKEKKRVFKSEDVVLELKGHVAAEVNATP